MSQVRLLRSDSDRMIAGVCGGIASYLGIDSVFVRLAFLLLLLASGVGFVLYIILMIIMPRESTLDRSSKQVFQENIDEYSGELSNNVSRIRKHPQGRTIAAGLLIPEFFLAMSITKIVTMPLRPMFKKMNMHSSDKTKAQGKFCTLKNDLESGKLGQAQITMPDRVLVINVKVRGDDVFKKAKKRLLLKKTLKKIFII